MHMADALLSPAVGAALWVGTLATVAWAGHRIRQDERVHLTPLMGMLGTFVFAAQMLNFSIPATGSSGHIGGGILLAALLGGPAAFLVITSVLLVQALLFADGGLLAWGANVFNLGFWPCLVVYPLLLKPLLQHHAHRPRVWGAWQTGSIMLAAVLGLQLGALGVVLETSLSGVSSLPLKGFLLLMQPVHLAIGLVEGAATAAILAFMARARPDLLDWRNTMQDADGRRQTPLSAMRVVAAWGFAAALLAGVGSWFASAQPDGLEWSVAHMTGAPEFPAGQSAWHQWLARLQHSTALLPDYSLGGGAEAGSGARKDAEAAWPKVDGETSMAGLVGGLVTLVLLLALAAWLRPRRKSVGPGATASKPR